VLGEFSREEKSDGSLDFARRQGGLLGVAGELGGLQGDSLEDVVDERVQDRHSSLRDSSVGVHLLQHLVDVRGVRLGSLGASLLGGDFLGALAAFFPTAAVLAILVFELTLNLTKVNIYDCCLNLDFFRVLAPPPFFHFHLAVKKKDAAVPSRYDPFISLFSVSR
jgi:hypothetical protein